MDVEAAVGDDADDDEEEDEEDAAFLREAEEAQQAERELDFAQRRRLNMAFSFPGEPRGAASHLATAIGSLERRYQDQDYVEEEPGIDDEEDEERVYGDQDAGAEDAARFLADIKDAQLWKIRTVKGVSEREIVISIMNKFVHFRQKGKPFPLLSAFAPDGIRGHVYVEAASPGQIREALQGFRSLIFSSIKIVPLNEMNSVYAMGEQTGKLLTRNELVRLKGGVYAGDLAQVTDVDEQEGSAWIRLIPRINLVELLDHRAGPPDKSRRAVARLLTREEIEAKGGIVEPGPNRGTFRFEGKVFLESGYLIRKVRPQLLIRGPDVSPTVQELKEFGRSFGEMGDDLASWQCLSSAIPGTRKGVYNIGDRVVVHSGDIAGLRGSVISIDGRAIGVQPEDKTLQGVVSVEADDLVKRFEVGDSVKAIGGMNTGASGLVTSVDLKTGTATVFYPALGRPFSCSLDHLQSCPNSGVATVSSLGGFSVGDLVQLSEHETGLIVQIDPGGALSVLTPDEKVERVPLSRLAAKRSNEFAVALDRNSIKFGVKAAVTLAGNGKGSVGRVCHIWKHHVFVKLANKDSGHYGFLVCDSKDLSVRAADGTARAPGRPTKPAAPWGGAGGPNSEERGPGRGGGFGGGFRGAGRGGPRGWTGQRVRVISGRNKGSFGEILSSESGGRLRIRLSQNDCAVCLNRDELIILGGSSGQRGRGGGDRRDLASTTAGSGTEQRSWTNYFQSVRQAAGGSRT